MLVHTCACGMPRPGALPTQPAQPAPISCLGIAWPLPTPRPPPPHTPHATHPNPTCLYLQGLDNAEIMRPVAKFSAEVPGPDAIAEVVTNAFRAAEGNGRPGAAFVSLPQVCWGVGAWRVGGVGRSGVGGNLHLSAAGVLGGSGPEGGGRGCRPGSAVASRPWLLVVGWGWGGAG